MTKHRIPVRVVRPPVAPRRATVSERDLRGPLSEKPTYPRRDADEVALNAALSDVDERDQGLYPGETELGEKEAAQPIRETEERSGAYRSSEDDDVDWRERAQRLEAEMAGYRRRQKLVAYAEAQAEQVALLKDVLSMADNLDRALVAARSQPAVRSQPIEPSQADALMQGVELTRAGLDRILAKYGLEQIQARGALFDPARHEAVYTVPAATRGVEPGIVVEVLEAGYRRRGTLFRPAKVVVAQ